MSVSKGSEAVFNSVANNMNSGSAIFNASIASVLNQVRSVATPTPSVQQTEYENAQMALYNGPANLLDTSKSYYTFTNEQTKYNQKFKDVATTIAKKYQAKFNELVHTSELLNNVYRTNYMNVQNAKNLYNTMVKKNNDFDIMGKNTLYDISTNDRKSYYEDQELNDLRWWYIAYLILYLTLVVIYVVILFVTPSEMTRYKRAGLAVLLGLYVFFADYLAHALIALWSYIMSFLPKNVYLSL
jgi:hypothetical protein